MAGAIVTVTLAACKFPLAALATFGVVIAISGYILYWQERKFRQQIEEQIEEQGRATVKAMDSAMSPDGKLSAHIKTLFQKTSDKTATEMLSVLIDHAPTQDVKMYLQAVRVTSYGIIP